MACQSNGSTVQKRLVLRADLKQSAIYNDIATGNAYGAGFHGVVKDKRALDEQCEQWRRRQIKQHRHARWDHHGIA
jgi:hypothetical protein